MNRDELKKTLYIALHELGLGDLEVELYVVSLLLGPSPISEIAKHLGISRPNVYKIIRELEARGLAKFSEKNKYARSFIVEPPTTIAELTRVRKETVGEITTSLISHMPDLLALYHQGEGDTKIKVLKGKEQYIRLFNQTLNEAKDEMQFFGSSDAFIHLTSWSHEEDYIRERVKRGIFMRVLLLMGNTSEVLRSNDEKELRETRILREVPDFPASFQLFANKAILWQSRAPLAILIEDEYVVQMLRAIFNLVWDYTPKNKKREDILP